MILIHSYFSLHIVPLNSFETLWSKNLAVCVYPEYFSSFLCHVVFVSFTIVVHERFFVHCLLIVNI